MCHCDNVLDTRDELRFDNCALLGYYAVSSENSLPAFRDNLSVPSSRVKNRRTTTCFYLIKYATYGALWHETGLNTDRTKHRHVTVHFLAVSFILLPDGMHKANYSPIRRRVRSMQLYANVFYSRHWRRLLPFPADWRSLLTRWPADPLTLVHVDVNRRLFLTLAVTNCFEVHSKRTLNSSTCFLQEH
jgi:hypothetical protein